MIFRVISWLNNPIVVFPLRAELILSLSKGASAVKDAIRVISEIRGWRRSFVLLRMLRALRG